VSMDRQFEMKKKLLSRFFVNCSQGEEGGGPLHEILRGEKRKVRRVVPTNREILFKDLLL